MTTDRLPPHSPEAEQAVLSCIFQSPQDCIPRCIQLLGGNGAEAMYDLRHQVIYRACVEKYEKREPIDLITLQQHLKDSKHLEEVGGIAYLLEIQDRVPSVANLEYYLGIVRDKFILRKTVRVCTEVVGRIYDYQGEIDPLMDEVERDILKIAESRAIGQNCQLSVRDLVRKNIDTIESFQAHHGQVLGLSTGFADFDKYTSGLQPGQMAVIAARPSMGKSSIAGNIVDHVAVTNKIPTGVFMLESTAEAWTMRMLCSRARVNIRHVRDGFLAERDYPKVTGASAQIASSPLHIDDTPNLSILELRARARRIYQQFGIQLLVVDYLQLLRSTSRRAENRQQEIADISSGLKSLGKELNIPVLVLSQLSRDLERDKNRRPRLSDLRESGAIEQDADLVGMLYKARKEHDDQPDTETVPVNLLIAKQRDGPSDVDVPLTFLKSFTRFESASKVSDYEADRQDTMNYSQPHND